MSYIVRCNDPLEFIGPFETHAEALKHCPDRARFSTILLSAPVVKTGIELITAERAKQLGKWEDLHDDGHCFELLEVAKQLLYCTSRNLKVSQGADWGLVEKHQDPIKRLTIAAALIAAEIDRRNRQ